MNYMLNEGGSAAPANKKKQDESASRAHLRSQLKKDNYKDARMKVTTMGDQTFIPVGRVVGQPVWHSGQYQPAPGTPEAVKKDNPNLNDAPDWVAQSQADTNKRNNAFVPAEMDRTGLSPQDILACAKESRMADAGTVAQKFGGDFRPALPTATTPEEQKKDLDGKAVYDACVADKKKAN